MPKQLEGFSDFVAEKMEEWTVPGLAIAVVKNGEVVFAQGYGLRDIHKGLKVTPETLFGLGSVTKAFTTMSIGILVDEGKLEWDTPVKAYLPSFKLYDPFATERISPRDLVVHISGLPRHDLVWLDSSCSRQELLERMAHLEPNRDFRTYFQYQNLTYVAAGYLVGQLVGNSWEQFVQERILDVLEMPSSNFSVQRSQESADYALPYRERDGEAVETPFLVLDAIGPAGSLNSSALDLANWVLLHLGAGEFKGRRVISESGLAQMHAPQVVAHGMPGLGITVRHGELGYVNYGLGWLLQRY